MTLDPDQLAALRALKRAFGDVQVLEVVEGVPGDTSPGLASQQLALAVEVPLAQVDPPVKAGVAARRAWP